MKNILFLFLLGACLICKSQTPGITFTVAGSSPAVKLGNDQIKTVTNVLTNYYIVAFTKNAANNDVATNNKFTVNITGLPFTANTAVKLIMFSYDGTTQRIINVSNHTTTNSNLTCTFNSSTLNYNGDSIKNNTGIYIIQVNQGNTTVALFSNDFLVIEKTKQIPASGSSFIYLVHFIDNYFSGRKSKINTYLDEISNAISNTRKKVNEWNLSYGLYSGTTTFYDIYIVGYKWVGVQGAFPGHFHTGNLEPAASSIEDGKRKIYIDCDILNTIGNTPETVMNEQELINSTIAHEFFHGIQWSHMSYNSLKTKFPDIASTTTINETGAELNKRLWLIEGQAKFLESVFMKYYSRQGIANIVYSPGTNSESYGQKCADFIIHALDKNYAYKSLHDMSYEYALFWRHIYEHLYSSGASDKDRLEILKQTCINYNTENSSSTPAIGRIMNNYLQNVYPGYSYTDVIRGLANRVYFRDSAYNKWDDPNGNNFYSAISPSVSETPITWTTDAEFPAAGTTWGIPNPLSFRTHKFIIKTPGTYTVALNGNPNNKSPVPAFKADIFVFDNTQVYSSYQIPNTYNTYACIKVPSAPAGDKNVAVIITRTDLNETLASFDYKIAITKTAPVSNYSMSVVADATKPPFTVRFTNTNTFNYAQSTTWNFGEPTSSLANSISRPYVPGKYYNIKQTILNCNGSISDAKSAAIAFVPYIEDLTVINQYSNTVYAQYTRTVSGNNLVFNKLGNYLIPASQKILIKAKVNGYVDYLKLTVLDNTGNTILTSDGIYNTTDNTYQFNVISTNQLKAGNYKLSLTGHFTISSTDYPKPSGTDPLASERAGHDIYNRAGNVPLSSYPAKLHTWNITNWADYTGPDDNYSITIDGPTLGDKFMEILITDNCNKNTTFYIHSIPEGSKLDFGDKTTTTISPKTIVTHTYTGVSGTVNKYVIKLSDPSGKPIMTRLVCFY